MRPVILAALVKLAIMTDRPFLCAGVYIGVKCLFALGLGHSFLSVLILGAIGFALASLYFWLLCKTQESALFWVVAILGILIGFV